MKRGDTVHGRAIIATAALLVFGSFVAGAGAGASELPQQAGTVDLRGQANGWIRGAVAYDRSGRSVADAGDVNGDGRADVLVGAPDASINGRRGSGSVYVVFGRETETYVDLGAIGEAGFRIDGAAAFDNAGQAVAAAGDVNGDGHGDVLVGAASVGNNGRSSSGSAYVVFGKSSSSPVDLAVLGASGFRIDGASAYDSTGASVAGAGDVNDDGRADVVVGAPYTGRSGSYGVGSAYVIFGKSSTATVDLAALDKGGFRIVGAAAHGNAGSSVGGAADVNGDGRADLVVGAPNVRNNARIGSGSAYVVFGKSSSSPVDLDVPGASGFRIDGDTYSGTGTSVAGAGDVNGDGRGDVVVGAPYAGRNGSFGVGSAYVVFGKSSPASVDLTALDEGGFRIEGANALDNAGASVAGSGDVNGDGRADVVVGAPGASNNGRVGSGSAYAIFGKASSSAVDLATLGGQGFRVDGGNVYYQTGRSVSGAGDVNGDGRPDIVVGAPNASTIDRGAEGTTYLVYGFGAPNLVYEPLIASTGDPLAPRLPKVLKRTGMPTFSVSPPLPRGLGIHQRTGAVFGTPRVARRQTTYMVTMHDFAGSVSAPLTITVKDTSGPAVTVSGSFRQPVLRQNAVIVRASCDEACTLRAMGRATALGARSEVGLKAAKATLRKRGSTTLRLGLSRAARIRLARLLGQGKPVRATVTVRAVDRSGNVTTARTAIVLGSW
jgi:FG-GAP repeat/Putative Ig domain